MWSANNSRRGVTLIELLIATFVLLIVMTVVLGSMINVRRGVDAGHLRLTMQNTAQMIEKKVSGALRNAVPISALDSSVEESVDMLFEPDHMLFISSDRYEDYGLEWVEIESGEFGYGPQVNLRRSSVGELNSMKEPEAINLDSDRLSANITFQYKFPADQPSTATAQNGQYPELVELTIIVSDKQQQAEGFSVTTAVDLKR